MDIEPHWSKNGQYFVSWNQQNRDITIWNIAHSKVAVNESSYEETFTEEGKDVVLFIIVLLNFFVIMKLISLSIKLKGFTIV